MPKEPTPKPVSILLSSSGRRVELLRAFQRAYAGLQLPGRIVATDINPLAPTLSLADSAYVVPSLESNQYIPALLNVVRKEKIALIFPLIDPDIPVLAAHAQEFADAGACVMTPPPEGVDIANDKWKTYQMYVEAGIPAAKTWLPEDFPAGQIEFPLMVKPRRGSAGKGVFRVQNRRALDFYLEQEDDPIIQEYLPGPEITSDVACSASGHVWAVVNRRRLEIRAGEVSKGVTMWDPRITEHCVRAAETIRARGPITVQCMLRDGSPFFTEINARFGGGCPLGIAAGADYPLWYLSEASGQEPPVPPLGTYRRDCYMTRFDESVFLAQEQRDNLAARQP